MIHALAAGLWLGSLAMSAVTAAVLFGAMRSLDPSFGVFAAYTDPQSDLGAGFIQNKVFLAGDIIQFIGACGVLGSTIVLIAFFGLPLRRISTGIRIFALGAAMTLVSYHLFILVPRMQTNAQSYWLAAEAGDMDAARKAHDRFEADHPTARAEMLATMISVALLLGAGVWSAASGAPGVEDKRPSKVEESRPARGDAGSGGGSP